MTSCEAMNSVFNITDENSSFSTTTTNRWIAEASEEIHDKLKDLLELRSQNDIGLHVKETEKRGA